MSDSQNSAADTKPCPACGEAIKSAALKCRFCGEDLAAFAAKHDAMTEQTLFQGSPAAFYRLPQYFWAVLTLGIMAIVYWVKSRSISYVITTQRIKVETGFLSKHVDILEAYRIDHIDIDKPIGMRMLGYGVLRIKTSDASEDRLAIYGIKHYEQLGEQIRQNFMRERERRGIRSIAQV